MYIYIMLQCILPCSQSQRHTDWLVSSAEAMEMELDPDWHGIEANAPSSNKELENIKSLKGIHTYIHYIIRDVRRKNIERWMLTAECAVVSRQPSRDHCP